MSNVVITKTTKIPLPAEKMWELLQQTKTLRNIGKGFVQYQGKFHAEWKVGQKCTVTPIFTKFPWSLAPSGPHTILVSNIDPVLMMIETKESGGFVTAWNHTMRITSSSHNDFCIYSDTVEIEADWWAMPVVKRLARALYNHRHARWLILAEQQK
ncbi:MAG: hypothetical protein V4668_03755 [Patescibacteria group bacterium]